ncbi:CAP Gly-rich domain-containing protein [Dipodascopsis tothii]|uniref:CAP Gly-rich domain-containing protein n=1 Tax=Dipodascopsis tothii TaxID=44089 RepID=UPI0034CD1E13
MADVNLFVSSANATTERRISPGWTIAQLKAKLEPICGVPPVWQQLELFVGAAQEGVRIEAADEDRTTVGAFELVPYARLHVADLRPASEQLDLTDVAAVDKFELTDAEYAARSDTVLAWKRQQKLGRFAAPGAAHFAAEAAAGGVVVGARCRTGDRRGTVRYVGRVPELPRAPVPEDDDIWVGVEFDEPVGRGDGRAGGRRVYACRPSHGSFLRPGAVEIGDFAEEDPFASDDEL